MTEPSMLSVDYQTANQRLDRFVATHLPDLSRNYVKQLIEDGHITVNGLERKPSHIVEHGDHIAVVLPIARPTDIPAEDLPIPVVYEDDDVLVLDKPAGMVVHPAPGHVSGTVVNALLFRYPNLQTSGDLRPGIVHRLDKDTSGLMIVAKNDLSRGFLTEQQHQRRMTKRYLALCYGHWRDPMGILDEPVGRHPTNRLRMAVVANGRHARTYYRVLEEIGPYSLVEATLGTGRTHQIRVHFAHKNRPIVGDMLYGPRKPKETFGLSRQFLHAYQLGLRLPIDGQWHGWVSELPEDLQHSLKILRERHGSEVINTPSKPEPAQTESVFDNEDEG